MEGEINANKPNEGAPRGVRLRYWVGGFFASILVIWAVSFLFADTVLLYEKCSDTGAWTRLPGGFHRQRSEGWATSHFGQWDVIGVDDISKIDVPAIAIWGDSHVEAFQVDQKEKMQEVLKGILSRGGMKGITAIGIGKSAESVADYYFKIPLYEKRCPRIMAHFIVICDLSDVLPDQPAERSIFRSKPEYHLIERDKQPDHLKLRTVLRKGGFDFVWLALARFGRDMKPRFSLGPRKPAPQRNAEIAYDPETGKAFAFLLQALRRRTEHPLFFVYAPQLPAVVSGQVRFTEQSAPMVTLFADECRRNGIGFVDMTTYFCDYYRTAHGFPRGFPNSRISQGHFNRNGHRLIAEAISKTCLSLNMKSDALHAN